MIINAHTQHRKNRVGSCVNIRDRKVSSNNESVGEYKNQLKWQSIQTLDYSLHCPLTADCFAIACIILKMSYLRRNTFRLRIKRSFTDVMNLRTRLFPHELFEHLITIHSEEWMLRRSLHYD